ncbi:hypothetical protein Gohar_009553, partial [Gossypium harknessii]|nr:hypothetical protein [Gossypium harknessii]
LLFSFIIAFISCVLSASSDKSSVLSHAASFTKESQEIVTGSTCDEGVGGATKLRRLKRRSEDTELYDVDRAEKLKSIAQDEFVSRQEKDFLSIMVSVYSTRFPTSNALELFKDEET